MAAQEELNRAMSAWRTGSAGPEARRVVLEAVLESAAAVSFSADRAWNPQRALSIALSAPRPEVDVLLDRLRSSTERRHVLELAGEEVSVDLVLGLVAEGYSHRLSDAAESVDWAMLAVEASGRLDNSRLSEDARALALGYLGNAFRVANRLPDAAIALKRAGAHMEQGTGDPTVATTLWRLEANVRVSLGEFHAARELLRKGERLALEVGDREGLARLRLALSCAEIEAGRPAEGLRVLAEGRVEEVFESLGLEVMVRSSRANQANALRALGRNEEALALRERVRAELVKSSDSLDVLRFRWTGAQALADQGALQQAERELLEVRRAYLERNMQNSASFVTLDLAVIYMRQSRWPELAAAAVAMTSVFDAAGVAPEAVVAVRMLAAAAKAQRWDREAAEAADWALSRRREGPGMDTA